MEGLKRLQDQFPIIREVRGQGLLIGVEFEPLPHSIRAHWKEVDPTGLSSVMIPNLESMLQDAAALYVMLNLLNHFGIYTQTARSNPRVLRVQPPLIVTDEETDTFLDAFGQCVIEIDFGVNTIDGIIAKSGLGQLAVQLQNTQQAGPGPGRKADAANLAQ